MTRISFSIPTNREGTLAIASRFANEPGTCLLYSGGSLDSAKRSFLFIYPYDNIRINGTTVTRKNKITATAKNPWEALKTIICDETNNSSSPEWIGYLGYEMGAFSDLSKQLPYRSGTYPDAYFQRCAITVSFDHETNQATVVVKDPHACGLDPATIKKVESLSSIDTWSTILSDTEYHPRSPQGLGIKQPLEELDNYVKQVIQAKELIYDGDIYQVNVSQRCVVAGDMVPFDTFAHLAQLNPAPFSAYLNLPDVQLISSSPERLLLRQGNMLETRPIKGTIARGKTKEQDAANKQALLASEKDRAELLMITDLMRNDLGRISEIGSVKVEELIRCEAYTNVFHLLSVIRSQALQGISSVDMLRACFPGGSITGCPKLRAMEVIDMLEQRWRGIYTGSIGYFCGNGDFDFNIAIRTMAVTDDGVDIQLGGAIVADSDPVAEYQETLDKGESIFRTLGVNVSV